MRDGKRESRPKLLGPVSCGSLNSLKFRQELGLPHYDSIASATTPYYSVYSGLPVYLDVGRLRRYIHLNGSIGIEQIVQASRQPLGTFIFTWGFISPLGQDQLLLTLGTTPVATGPETPSRIQCFRKSAARSPTHLAKEADISIPTQ